MRLIKPKKLRPKDVIGIIAPASPVTDESKIENGVKYLESLGYRVEVGKFVRERIGYLAGSDSERVSDIHEMFQNKKISAIFSLRGGYGSNRIIDKIDYSLIRKNAKIFVGYSDITSLQLAFYTQAGLITFAGPMLAPDFGDTVNPNSEELFWKILTSTRRIGKLKNPENEHFYSLNEFNGAGKLLGGNLTNLVSLLGTKYSPTFNNSVIFLEEINEPPYKIDRMFNQLRLHNVFKRIKGIVLGRFVNCYDPELHKNTLSLNEVILDYFSELEKPVIYNLKHGHIFPKLTLPIGVKTKLNGKLKAIEIEESAVR